MICLLSTLVSLSVYEYKYSQTSQYKILQIKSKNLLDFTYIYIMQWCSNKCINSQLWVYQNFAAAQTLGFKIDLTVWSNFFSVLALGYNQPTLPVSAALIWNIRLLGSKWLGGSLFPMLMSYDMMSYNMHAQPFYVIGHFQGEDSCLAVGQKNLLRQS